MTHILLTLLPRVFHPASALGTSVAIAVVHLDLHDAAVAAQLEAAASAWLVPQLDADLATELRPQLLPVVPRLPTWQVTARWLRGHKPQQGAATVRGPALPLAWSAASADTASALPDTQVRRTTVVRATAPPAPPAAPTPASQVGDLTFTVGVTPKQREARARVVLPYLAAQTDAQTPVAAPPASGTIEYHADSADDLDEDDPDDDLFI